MGRGCSLPEAVGRHGSRHSCPRLGPPDTRNDALAAPTDAHGCPLSRRRGTLGLTVRERQNQAVLTVQRGRQHGFETRLASSPSSFPRNRRSPPQSRNLHLDALIDAQQDDGSWKPNFAMWTPVVAHEWDGYVTLIRLKTLQVYNRIV